MKSLIAMSLIASMLCLCMPVFAGLEVETSTVTHRVSSGGSAGGSVTTVSHKHRHKRQGRKHRSSSTTVVKTSASN